MSPKSAPAWCLSASSSEVAQPEFVALGCRKLRRTAYGKCMGIKLTGSHRIELVRFSIARCIPEAREQRNLRSEIMVHANARRIHVGGERSAGNSGVGQSSRIAGRIDNLLPDGGNVFSTATAAGGTDP